MLIKSCAAVLVVVITLLVGDYLRSDVAVENVDLGAVGSDERCRFSTLITNESDGDVRIVGIEACCTTKISDYPTIVKAHSTGVISGVTSVPSESGTFRRRIVVFVNNNNRLLVLPLYINAVAIAS